jgi:hypothetical protein
MYTRFVILTLLLTGAAPPSLIFDDEAPLSRAVKSESPPTIFNRLDPSMRMTLDERGKGVALHNRSLDDAARRKAVRSDLYRFALAKFDGITLPWKDAEVAYLDNLVEDVCKPYDAVIRSAAMTASPSRTSPPEEDFTVKRWHMSKLGGRDVPVWGVKDPDHPGVILVVRAEQPPEVRSLMGSPAVPPLSLPQMSFSQTPVLPPPMMYADSPVLSQGVSGGCVGGSCGASTPLMSRPSFLGSMPGGGCASGSCGR